MDISIVAALAAVAVVAYAAMRALHVPVNLRDMSDRDLQLELYLERCAGRDGAEYLEELDRRGAPHVMPAKAHE